MLEHIIEDLQQTSDQLLIIASGDILPSAQLLLFKARANIADAKTNLRLAETRIVPTTSANQKQTNQKPKET